MRLLVFATMIAPIYRLGNRAGSRIFGLEGAQVFRRIRLVMIAVAALISMTALDGWFWGD
ncbi:MAG: hypothetical protein NTW20_07575 [Rhodobacterales bacterium]|nr:hypothetical protein [Rhodobacterales bacterium]